MKIFQKNYLYIWLRRRQKYRKDKIRHSRICGTSNCPSEETKKHSFGVPLDSILNELDGRELCAVLATITDERQNRFRAAARTEVFQKRVLLFVLVSTSSKNIDRGRPLIWWLERVWLKAKPRTSETCVREEAALLPTEESWAEFRLTAGKVPCRHAPLVRQLTYFRNTSRTWSNTNSKFSIEVRLQEKKVLETLYLAQFALSQNFKFLIPIYNILMILQASHNVEITEIKM
jgi:hypothetical protein